LLRNNSQKKAGESRPLFFTIVQVITGSLQHKDPSRQETSVNLPVFLVYLSVTL